MSDKIKCPTCGKSFNREEYKLEFHKHGRQGKCPSKKCGKKVFMSSPARGIIKDENGVGRKRFRNK